MNAFVYPTELSPHANLSRYLSRIRTFPMLEVNEEIDLAKRWLKTGDADASHLLVCSHLRLVAKIAMGFRGYGLPVAELISEGNVGMMQAVRRFDPERGFRLSTYAMWWIRASIQEYILHSWSLVKMGTTAAQKKLFFNLRKIKGQMQLIEEGDLHPDHVETIANRLQVPTREVVNMNRRMSAADQSLNIPIHESGGGGEWQDWLVDEQDSQEKILGDHEEFDYRHGLLIRAMKSLSEREQNILHQRRLKEDPSTLQTLSDEYGISRERVRQIEVRAFEKVQKTVKNADLNQKLSHANAALSLKTSLE